MQTYQPENEHLANGESRVVHTFERAGLGKALFMFTGEVTEHVQNIPGCAPRASGSCDYCSACIRYGFGVKSSDGKTFKVGCDCIHKTGDAGLVKEISVAERKLKDMKNKRAKEAKLARQNAYVEAQMAKLETMAGTIAAKPHPVKHHADNGLTMMDYIRWLLNNGYNAKAADYIYSATK